MEDKTFELLTRMYSDITARLDTIDQKLDEKVDKSDIVPIETNLDSNSKALFDEYKQTFEKLIAVEEKVDSIYEKVEKQDVEIRVIKGGKTQNP
jgi:hypothetical protein